MLTASLDRVAEGNGFSRNDVMRPQSSISTIPNLVVSGKFFIVRAVQWHRHVSHRDKAWACITQRLGTGMYHIETRYGHVSHRDKARACITQRQGTGMYHIETRHGHESHRDKARACK